MAKQSYARQAKDDTLRKLADRIQARAIRRCGELLRQVPVARGANQNIQEGDLPKVETRESAAVAAGLSEHQRKTALRVAAVPEQQFVAQVESDTPPTVTALAKQSTTPRPAVQPLVDLAGIPAADVPQRSLAPHVLHEQCQRCHDLVSPSVEKDWKTDYAWWQRQQRLGATGALQVVLPIAAVLVSPPSAADLLHAIDHRAVRLFGHMPIAEQRLLKEGTNRLGGVIELLSFIPFDGEVVAAPDAEYERNDVKGVARHEAKKVDDAFKHEE